MISSFSLLQYDQSYSWASFSLCKRSCALVWLEGSNTKIGLFESRCSPSFQGNSAFVRFVFHGRLEYSTIWAVQVGQRQTAPALKTPPHLPLLPLQTHLLQIWNTLDLLEGTMQVIALHIGSTHSRHRLFPWQTVLLSSLPGAYTKPSRSSRSCKHLAIPSVPVCGYHHSTVIRHHHRCTIHG